MLTRYPDLNRMEMIVLLNLKELYPDRFKSIETIPKVRLYAAFPQTWSDTAGGFSEPGMMTGQAFTTQITSVFEAEFPDNGEKEYFVFFDEKPAYRVYQASDIFLEDLKNLKLKSRYEASSAY